MERVGGAWRADHCGGQTPTEKVVVLLESLTTSRTMVSGVSPCVVTFRHRSYITLPPATVMSSMVATLISVAHKTQ